MQHKLFNPNFDEHGYIQVYTGDGKGKTTASLGLTLRALGRGWNVLIVMFTKGGCDYGELFSFSELSEKIKDKLDIVQAGLDRIVYKSNLNDEDRAAVHKGWSFVKENAYSGKYQLVVLDEANIAVDLDLIPLEEMIEFLKNKPEKIEVVLTGRRANDKIIELAHLVSNI